MPLNINIFLEKFAECAMASFINFFSGYDHVKLNSKCKNMTIFIIPLGLLRQTTILQKITNSTAQFVRIVTKILKKYIPHICLLFMNNINVKSPKTIYNNKEVIPKIRKYILKYIIWINEVLANLERAKYTILKIKSQFCMPGLRVIEFIYDTLKRHPNIFKVIKIVK
jgi:hypothetical protein